MWGIEKGKHGHEKSTNRRVHLWSQVTISCLKARHFALSELTPCVKTVVAFKASVQIHTLKPMTSCLLQPRQWAIPSQISWIGSPHKPMISLYCMPSKTSVLGISIFANFMEWNMLTYSIELPMKHQKIILINHVI